MFDDENSSIGNDQHSNGDEDGLSAGGNAGDQHTRAPTVAEPVVFVRGVNEERNKDRRGLPLVLYVLGPITYNDILQKERRHTKFCLMSQRDDLLHLCPASNSMD
jgi:hypothetical protein